MQQPWGTACSQSIDHMVFGSYRRYRYILLLYVMCHTTYVYEFYLKRSLSNGQEFSSKYG
jgi:hypothetical protein